MAAWFYAIEEETRALIEEGTQLQAEEGRLVAPITVNADELQAIRDALPQNIRDFIDEGKAIAEQEFSEVAKVVYRLTGRDPRPVPGYFRRRRHMVTDVTGFPPTWADAARRYAENLGFLRERKGGTKSPILVEDFLTALIDHMTDIARVQHVAEPTRRAASVLLNHQVQEAITARHGAHAVASLLTHLEAASMVNPVKTDQTAIVVRALNSNMAAAKLGINPTSWLRQLGGWARLRPFLGGKLWAIGMQQWPNVAMDEMVRWSGFFWDRYVSDIAGRFGGVIPAAVFGTDQSTFKTAMDHAAQAFAQGHIADGIRALREASMSTLQILNFFDGIIARTAWAAYKAQVMAEHPDWSEAKQMEWVAEKASDAIRETQNSSSVLDLSTMALQGRGRWWSTFLLFSSDRFKTANRLRRAFAESQERGAEVLAAEVANMAVGMVVGNGWPLLVAIMLAGLGGDDGEVEEAWKRAIALDRNLIRALQETLTLIDPTGAINELVAIAAFQNKAIFETAAQSTMTDMGRQLAKFSVTATRQALSGETEQALHSAAFGLINASLDMAALGGLNPLDTQMRLILRQIEKRTKPQGRVEGF
jgi:hypothetical protein